MPPVLVFAILATVGAALAASSMFVLRAIGARPGLARRLAGPPGVAVGSLLDADDLPSRPIRVAGRIRCADPLDAADGQGLVAYHRDVEVRLPTGWRSVERQRETRSFELWDHAGSLTVDPAQAAEPLIVIPGVWRGDPAELDEPQASAVARLAERHGGTSGARAVTRAIATTDHLSVLALARRAPGGDVMLAPPPGGYLITNLALPDAMRLLGGRHRRLLIAAIAGIGIGIVLLVAGALGMVTVGLAGG